jgi:hypothetical protein
VEFIVISAFTDVDGTPKRVGDRIELSPHRAAALKRQQIIWGPVGPIPLPAPRAIIIGHPGHVTSREENIDGLASALLLADALKATINAHYADAADHTTAIDNVNTLVNPDPYDIPSLIALVSEMITSYVAHDDDAELGAAWAYHAAQEAADASLTSVVAPTDLQECITKLNDIKDNFNDHDADGTAHGVGGSHQEVTLDAAYGAIIRVDAPLALPGDGVGWSILDSGTGVVTGVWATAGPEFIDFEFSADPQNDAIISYLVVR